MLWREAFGLDSFSFAIADLQLHLRQNEIMPSGLATPTQKSDHSDRDQITTTHPCEPPMRYLNTAGLIIFALAVLIFCLQNLATVTVRYLGWELSIPLAAVAFGNYLLGMASGWGVLSFLKRSVKAVKTRKE